MHWYHETNVDVASKFLNEGFKVGTYFGKHWNRKMKKEEYLVVFTFGEVGR
jgi:hypothetical protein